MDKKLLRRYKLYYFPQKGGADYTFPETLSKEKCLSIDYNPEEIIGKHIGICKDGDAEFTDCVDYDKQKYTKVYSCDQELNDFFNEKKGEITVKFWWYWQQYRTWVPYNEEENEKIENPPLGQNIFSLNENNVYQINLNEMLQEQILNTRNHRMIRRLPLFTKHEPAEETLRHMSSDTLYKVDRKDGHDSRFKIGEVKGTHSNIDIIDLDKYAAKPSQNLLTINLDPQHSYSSMVRSINDRSIPKKPSTGNNWIFSWE